MINFMKKNQSSLDVFIAVHDQDLILKCEENRLFRNLIDYRYLFLGFRPVDKLCDIMDKVIVVRDLPHNIEDKKCLYDYTGIWALVHNIHLVNGSHIVFIHYDCFIYENFLKEIKVAIKKSPDCFISFQPHLLSCDYFLTDRFAKTTIKACKEVYGIDLIQRNKELMSKGELYWQGGGSFATSVEITRKYIDWVEPLLPQIIADPMAAHNIERTVKFFCSENNITEVFLKNVMEHIYNSSHDQEYRAADHVLWSQQRFSKYMEGLLFSEREAVVRKNCLGLIKTVKKNGNIKHYILGVKVYDKQIVDDVKTYRYLFGFIKIKKKPSVKKIYVFGVQLYHKTCVFNILSERLESSNKILVEKLESNNKILVEKLESNKVMIDKIKAGINSLTPLSPEKYIDISQRLITAAFWHPQIFKQYRGCFRGKKVVLIGAGPTLLQFRPIKDAIYVGCNRAFKYDKVNFDFLWTIDNIGIQNWFEDFLNYRVGKCVKFIGDQNLGLGYQIPETRIPLDILRYVTYANLLFCKFNLDISTSPLCNGATVALQALQWILYTQPAEVYIVGVDCTLSSRQYFFSDCNEETTKHETEDLINSDDLNVIFFKKIKDFASIYYPDTKIISVNPVRLKGIFEDMYM